MAPLPSLCIGSDIDYDDVKAGTASDPDRQLVVSIDVRTEATEPGSDLVEHQPCNPAIAMFRRDRIRYILAINPERRDRLLVKFEYEKIRLRQPEPSIEPSHVVVPGNYVLIP